VPCCTICAVTGASRRLHSHHAVGPQSVLSADRTAARKRRKPISPSRLSAPSQNSRSSPSMATRSTSAAACTVLRRPRSSTSPSTPRTSLSLRLRSGWLAQGPVAYSPLLNPEKALRRRNLVLSEMESTASSPTSRLNRAARLRWSSYHPARNVRCPWFQEEVRRELEKRFGAEESTKPACALTPPLTGSAAVRQQRRERRLGAMSDAVAGRVSSKMSSPKTHHRGLQASRLGHGQRPATMSTPSSRARCA